jgi:hypothetical protein
MAYSDPKLANFSLRGLQIEELRELAQRHLDKDDSLVMAMGKSELIIDLSEAVSENRQLSLALRKRSISIKPSFYLMRFRGKTKFYSNLQRARSNAICKTNRMAYEALKASL